MWNKWRNYQGKLQNNKIKTSSGHNYILDSGWFCRWKEHRPRSYVTRLFIPAFFIHGLCDHALGKALSHLRIQFLFCCREKQHQQNSQNGPKVVRKLCILSVFFFTLIPFIQMGVKPQPPVSRKNFRYHFVEILPFLVSSMLDHQKSKRVPEKHLLLLYWLCQSLWLYESQWTVENS